MNTVLERRREHMATQLKLGRRDLGYSRNRLAQESGIDQDSIYRIEHGLQEPTLGELYKLAEILGLPISELVAEPRELWKPPSWFTRLWDNPWLIAGLFAAGGVALVGVSVWIHTRSGISQ